MCGRYAVTKDPARLSEEFGALDATDGHVTGPDHNVAPTKQVMAVVQRHPRAGDDRAETDPASTVRSLRVMRWGLVPFWSKDPSSGARMINARAESAPSKPAFRAAVAKRRCLIPADGWFEWRRTPEGKQPYFMTGGDGASLALAGIWETWRDTTAEPDAPPLVTCSVLTTPAVGVLTDIHHRMPLLMPARSWAAWLDPDMSDVTELLAAPSRDLVEGLELRPVSAAVNNVRNNGPELLEPVTPALDHPGENPGEQALFEADHSEAGQSEAGQSEVGHRTR